MEAVIGASFITAFIAGIAALFAPCCITVLLPAYLGSVFRQKKTVFLMTFVFFLGLLMVFLPLGLGVAGLGKLFSQYHNLIYTIGGLFLISVGLTILFGKHFSFSIFKRPNRENYKVKNAGSVFTLGIFSGFATLCCAPVLAGALALAALPGSIFWGGLYTLTYALGMVAPLFIIAYFLDKTDFAQRVMFFKKPVSYSIAGKTIVITVAEILAGLTFLLMGVLIIYLALSNQLAMKGSGYQTTVNIYSANITDFITNYLGKTPLAVWPIVIAALFGLIIWLAFKRKK